MKIYYDKNTRNITIEGYGKLFSQGSLIASSDSDNVYISYKTTGINEIYVSYTDIQKEDGSAAGTSANEVVMYLNTEFDKGIDSGEGEFINLSVDVVISSPKIKVGDIIIVTPVSNALNDIIFIKSVVDGSFTVSRIVVNTLNLLTNNLKFNWLKI